MAFPLLPLGLFAPGAAGMEEPVLGRTTYQVDVRMFFGLYPFHLEGAIEEQVDRAAGRYQVVATGAGSEISNRLESVGIIRSGRFVPRATQVFMSLWGHESRTAVTYDFERGLIAYDHRSHPFFLGGRREIHTLLHPQAEHPVDDVVTAALNFADGALVPDTTGAFRLYLVSRLPAESPQPEAGNATDAQAGIVPVMLRMARDPRRGRGVGELDLSRLSSWARPGHPARIVFGPNRLPDSVQEDLSLGTSVRIGFQFPERAVSAPPGPHRSI